jgi:GTPase SAR1 family protein
MNYISTTKSILIEFIQFIKESPWVNVYSVQLQQLLNEIDEPCKLAIAGRVKAGKSSLVNTLLGGDFAKVGITETTATINIFKYGTPPDKNFPIQCYYVDGHNEWVSKSFLDSLQGTSDESLNKAAEIRHLVYFINDSRLQDVILIDTPGTNAVVDEHQNQTELYFGLRRRHNSDTIELSNNADAVIYLLGEVAHASNQDFLSSLNETLGQRANINTLGVMSQIDLSDDRLFNKEVRAKDLQHRLSYYISSVVSISAGLKYYLPEKKEAERIKSILMKFNSEENLINCLEMESVFMMLILPGIKVSLEERKSIRHLSDGMPWRVFVVIARELYKHDVDSALRILEDYSGIEQLRNTLNKQFFERSKILRCNNVVEKLYEILMNLLKYGGLEKLREEANIKERCLDECNNLSSAVSIILKRMIEEHMKSTQYIKDTENKLLKIKEQVLRIKQITERINNDFYCLQLLSDNKGIFKSDEFEELSELFLYKSKAIKYDDRRSYWQDVSFRSISEIKQTIAERAYQKYDEL